MRDYTNPDDKQQELYDQINDSSVERGIPTDLNVKKKSTMTKVLFLVAGLAVTGIAISGIMSYFGGGEEDAPPKQADMIGNTQQKNFKVEQDEIALEIPSDAQASEPDAEAASEVSFTSQSEANENRQNPATETIAAAPPVDERLEGDVVIEVGSGMGVSAAVGGRDSGEAGGSGLDSSCRHVELRCLPCNGCAEPWRHNLSLDTWNRYPVYDNHEDCNDLPGFDALSGR